MGRVGMRKSLVIGLGGTGSWVCDHLKDRLVQDARYVRVAKEGVGVVTDPRYGRAEVPSVAIRAFDVDQGARPGVGEGVQLLPGSEDRYVEAPIGQVLQHLKDVPDDDPQATYHEIRGWLSHDRARNYQVLSAMQFLQTGLGEVRQFGRMAFFVDLQQDQTVSTTLKQALQAINRTAGPLETGSVHIYVVSSLAGGTGAGFLVDVLTMLDKLVPETLGPGVPMQKVGMFILPTAFRAVLKPLQFEKVAANGMAALREMERMINAPESFSITYREGDGPVTLHNQALDLVYLVDGSRSEASAPSLTGLNGDDVMTVGLPPAISDVIYTHIFPSSGGTLGRDIANLFQDLGDAHIRARYSTFGSYAVTYDWERLTRSLAHRAAIELVDALLADSEVRGTVRVESFAANGATGALSSAGFEQALPQFVSAMLSDPVNAPAFWMPDPTAFMPADANHAAAVPQVPALLSDYSAIKAPIYTAYGSEAMITEVEGDAEFGVVGRVNEYVGGARKDAALSDGGEATLRGTLKANMEAGVGEFERALRIATAAVADEGDRIGGLSAAASMIVAIRQRLVTARRKLEENQIEWVNGKMLEDARNQLTRRRNAMGVRFKFNSPGKQTRYLAAANALLLAKTQDESYKAGVRVLGLAEAVCERMLADVTRWREDLAGLRAGLVERRQPIDDARIRLDAALQRRYVPQPGDGMEEALYGECMLGERDGWRERTRDALASREDGKGFGWRYSEGGPLGPRVVASTPGMRATDRADHDQLMDVNDLLAVVLPHFERLRTKSVFEVLECGVDPSSLRAAADALAKELMGNSAVFSTNDAVAAQFNRQDGQPIHKNMGYVFADWLSTGPGSELSMLVRAAIDAVDPALVQPLTTWTDAGGTAYDIEESLPTRDKILSLRVSHVLDLLSFEGVQALKDDYDRRKQGCGVRREEDKRFPEPHVLPPEMQAAALEAKSEDWAREGLLDDQVDMLPATAVAMHRPENKAFLNALVQNLVLGLVQREVDPIGEVVTWRLRPGGEVLGEANVSAGSDFTLDSALAGVLLDRRSRPSRRASDRGVNQGGRRKVLLEALNRNLEGIDPVEREEALRRFALERPESSGWTSGGVTGDLLRLLAVEMATL